MKQVLTKTVASLLLAAMVLCDSSVYVLAETVSGSGDTATAEVSATSEDEAADPATLSDPDITDTSTEQSDPSAGQTESSVAEEGADETENGEGSADITEPDDSSDPDNEEGEEEPANTENPTDPSAVPTAPEEEEEPEFEEVHFDTAEPEMAFGRGGRVAARRFFSFANQSRGDYFHRIYNQLSDEAQTIYDSLLDNADDFIKYSYNSGEISINYYEGANKETTNMQAVADRAFLDFYDAFGAVMRDNPDIFWPDGNKIHIGFTYTGYQTGGKIIYNKLSLTVGRRYSNDTMLLSRYSKDTESQARAAINADKTRFDNAVSRIIDNDEFRSLDSVAQKAGYINDKLTLYNYYNRYVARSMGDYSFAHISISALIAQESDLTWLGSSDDNGDTNAPVCEGYAYAFKALCNEAGIPCMIVTGDGHAWNFIQTEDGVWYAVDTTWDDPVRADEWTNRATPAALIRRWFMVGSSTDCANNGKDFLEEGHHPNSAYYTAGTVPSVPVISTTAAPDRLLGATLETVDDPAPTGSGGRITVRFQTDKTGTYYWVIRAKDSAEPDVYDIQDGVETVDNGSGNGSISSNMTGSDKQITLKTPVLEAGYYDLYIVELSGDEYISNVISYKNIHVAPGLTSVELRDFAANAAAGIPAKNELYVGWGIPVSYRVTPAELSGTATVTIESSDTDRLKVNNTSHTVYPQQPGDVNVRVKAVYEPEGEEEQVVYSDWLTVKCVYPVGKIFEYYGKRFASDKEHLYSGWLTLTGNVYQTRKVDGNYKVWYFAPYGGDEDPRAVKGERTITDEEGNEKTYLFGDNCELIKQWIKLDSMAFDQIPASANQTGAIDENTLSYGSTYVLSAKLSPANNNINDSFDPEWTSSDPSVIKVTPLGVSGDRNNLNKEIRARIEVLKLPDDPSTPVTISLRAGEYMEYTGEVDGHSVTRYVDNRKTASISIKVKYPVGWHRIGDSTYYGKVTDTTPRDVVHLTGLQTIDGKRYYFEESGADIGAMVTGTRDIGGQLYLFGDDGALVSIVDKKGFAKLPEGTVYFDDDGNMVRNSVVTDKHGNRYYLDPQGHLLTGGWIEYNPAEHPAQTLYMYASSDGTLCDGFTTINAKKYIFTETQVLGDTYPCVLAKGMVHLGTDTYYVFEADDKVDCTVAFGYFVLESSGERKAYYANLQSAKNAGVLQSGWILVNGVWRQFAPADDTDPFAEISSSASTGWIQIKGSPKRFYRKSNGKFLSGWQTIDGKRYYFTADGSVGTGLWRIGNYYYYFGETNNWDEDAGEPGAGDNYGIMQTGRVSYDDDSGHHTNFFNTNGTRLTGWRMHTETVSGTSVNRWDFYNPATAEALGVTAIEGKAGWYEKDNGTERFIYYFVNNSSLATGWRTVDGRKYYFDTAADANGATGRMRTGITTIGANKYYLREEAGDSYGELLTGYSLAKDRDGTDRRYLANANGVLLLGWQKVDGEWAFFDYVKGYRLDDELIGRDNWAVISETNGGVTSYYKYYFRNGSTPVTGLQNIDGRYYLFGNVKNTAEYGRLLTGLIKYGNNYYYGRTYSNEDGARALEAGQLYTGEFTVNEAGTNITRYAGTNYVIAQGWANINGRFKYFLTEKDANEYGSTVGRSVRIDRCDDTFINCEWYEGKEAPFNGEYFCFRNGTTLLKGWQTVNGYAYYFDPSSGRLWTGVQKIGNYWYDLSGSAVNGFMGHYRKTGWSNGTSGLSDYYYNANGTRATGWLKVDGKSYYFTPQPSGVVLDADDFGKKVTNEVILYNKNRYVLDDTDGHMLTGYCTLGTKNYYTNANGIMLYGWQIIEGRPHYFRQASETDPGVEVTSSATDDNFVRIDVGGSVYKYFYLKSGTTMTTGFLNLAGKYYFFNNAAGTLIGSMAEGWFDYPGNKKRYYAYPQTHALVTAGTMHVGELAKGYCTNLTGDGKNYYFNTSFQMMTGLQLIDGSYHYFDPDPASATYGSEQALEQFGTVAGFYKMPDGRIVFISKGKLLTGWQTIEGRKYYFDSYGTLLTGEYRIGNVVYYSYTVEDATTAGNTGLTGSIWTGFRSISEGGVRATLYYDGYGRRTSGWQKVGNDYYYFDPSNGHMKTGSFVVGSYTYFTDAEGRRLTGLVNYNGNRYYCNANGIALSGWQTIKVDGANRKFYFDAYGIMQTGLIKIGNYYYYLRTDGEDLKGAMYTGAFTVNEGGQDHTYYAASSGILQFGTFNIGGKLWYFANEYDRNTYGADVCLGYEMTQYSSGGSVRANWYRIDFTDAASPVINTDYILIYATSGTKRLTGWQTIAGLDGVRRRYYFIPSNGAMATGYVTISGKEYRFGSDEGDPSTFGTFNAATMSGFVRIEGTEKYRYINANGMSVTGTISKVYGPRDTAHTQGLGTFYLYPDGTVATGRVKIGSYYYFFNDADGPDLGRMAVNEEVTTDGSTYFFAANGTMFSGWQKVGNTYRYFGPELVRGTRYTRNGVDFYIANIGGTYWRLDADGTRMAQPSSPATTKGYDIYTGLYTDVYSRLYAGTQTVTVGGITKKHYFPAGTGVNYTSNPADRDKSYNCYCDGPVKIGNYRYFFDEDGAFATGYTTINTAGVHGNYLFSTSNYTMLTGWQYADGAYRFFDPATGAENPTTTSVAITAREGWYELSVGGKPARYYLRGGKPLTGWQSVASMYGDHAKKRYYFNPNGTLAYTENATGELAIGNVIYHTVPYDPGNPDVDFGQTVTGFYATQGRFRYTDANGKAYSGWLNLNGYRYYLNPSGFLCAGITDYSGKKYYLKDYPDSQAAMRNPVTNPVYGSLQYGVIHTDEPVGEYFAASNGILSAGWVFNRVGNTYEPAYYSTDIATYGKRQAVTPLVNAAGSRTDWYETGGKLFNIAGGRTLRKGFFNQTVNIAGVNTVCRFNLDASTGELIQTGGIIKIGNYKYYSKERADMPAGYPRYVTMTGRFDEAGGSYLANANGILYTGLVNEKRGNVTYTHFYDPENCRMFKGGAFSYANNVYYAYTAQDETEGRIPAGYTVGDLAMGRVRLSIGGTESNYYFDGNKVRRSGWFTFTEADRRSYKYYYDADGRRFENGPKTIGGKVYYFGPDGKLITGVYADATGSYLTSSAGEILKGWNLVTDPSTKVRSWRYYRLSDGKELTAAGIDDNNKMIYVPGTVAGNYWGVVKEAGTVSAYYLNKNSALLKNGEYAVSGKYYYFDAQGRMQADGSGISNIADANGNAVTPAADVNLKIIGSAKFIFRPVDTGVLAAYDGTGDFGGYAVAGFMRDDDGKLYWANDKGQLTKGWIAFTKDGRKCYSYGDDMFRLLTGPSYIGTNRYLFDDAANLGRRLTPDLAGEDGLVVYNGRKYLTNTSGVILTGWQNVKNRSNVYSWHYFDPSTGEEIAAAGGFSNNWITLVNGQKFYFTNGRTPAKGFTVIGGRRYYFDQTTGVLKQAAAGQYKRFTVGAETYECDPDGVVTIGWGYLYRRTDGTYAARTDLTSPANTTANVYYDTYGRMVRGFATVTGAAVGVYYFDTNGTMASGITTIGGKKYVLGSNTGAVLVGGSSSPVLSFDRGKLHKNYYGQLDDDADKKYRSDAAGVLATGWQSFTDAGVASWHFFDPATGSELTGAGEADGAFTWYTINSPSGERMRYCFKSNRLLTGWQNINGRSYWFDGTGRMAVGFKKIGNATYYFCETISEYDHSKEGMLMKNGIINVGGKYYYMAASGAYLTGWFTIGGYKYYGYPATGQLAVGMARIDGSTYYFSEAEATLGRLQTGFIKLSDLGQPYYDRNPGASNTYYAQSNGAIVTSGWLNIKHDPKVSNSQEWSYYFAPNRPGVAIGSYTLSGEMVTGDVLIDQRGNVTYLDNGIGANDGYGTFDENIGQYYRFNSETGARRKEVLYFYGNYYGDYIDNNQKNTIASMSKFINSDTLFAGETDDFILVNGDSNRQLRDKGLIDAALYDVPFPKCASNSVPDERASYKVRSDIAQKGVNGPAAGADGHVDVYDTQYYSEHVYERASRKYGPRNLVLMGASSGAGICLGLYAYAVGRGDDRYLPDKVLLLSPWVDVSMSNPDCRKITAAQSGGTDVGTLRYWGARYTRDKDYVDDGDNRKTYADIPGAGFNYAFANSLALNLRGMNNVFMYSGSYDPCVYDCARLVNMSKTYGSNMVLYNYARERHGFMFATSSNYKATVTMDVCRKIMMQ